jgi:hypothetical protein
MVGLKSYNVSYQSVHNGWGGEEPEEEVFYYEERFVMKYGRPISNKIFALTQGMPEPMVIVAEYMDSKAGGFTWGRL